MSDLNSYTQFLDKAMQTIEDAGLDVSSYWLDHFAWQCKTDEEYDEMKPKVLEIADEISEEMLSDRRVGVFKLKSPIQYMGNKIIAVELIAPKEGKPRPSGYQHLEFVVDIAFEELMKKYPNINWNTGSMDRAEFSHLVIDFDNGVTVKFHYNDIISTIEKSRT